jgi:hypothetical protein
MEEWLLYFADGLTQEFERVATRVRELNGLTEQVARTIQLTPNQEQAVAALTTGDRDEISRAEYEKLAGIKRTQAKVDLANLTQAGVLRAVGSGPRTRYRLAIKPVRTGDGASPGPARTWTEDRIRTELQTFLAGRRYWPSAREFRDADQMPLYQAASRRGGIERWVRELGLERLPASS